MVSFCAPRIARGAYRQARIGGLVEVVSDAVIGCAGVAFSSGGPEASRTDVAALFAGPGCRIIIVRPCAGVDAHLSNQEVPINTALAINRIRAGLAFMILNKAFGKACIRFVGPVKWRVKSWSKSSGGGERESLPCFGQAKEGVLFGFSGRPRCL